jgi:hypothetical protein
VVFVETMPYTWIEIATGLALALGDYETHGVAMPVRVAADVPLPGFRHRLVLAAEYAHYSRWFMTEPEVLPGVQLDVGSVRASWRVFPYARRGMHLDAGVGISVLHDRLAIALPERRVMSARTGVGVPVEVGVGWMVHRRIDVDVRYSYTAPIVGDALGQLGIALGVRL